MKAKTKLTKLWSFLLSLVMLLSLLPTTALAAGSYPAAEAVLVDGDKYFGGPGKLYYKNNDPADNFTGTAEDYNAAYDPDTGTLTLNGYNGGTITAGGTGSKITVVLIGTNSINNGELDSPYGGDITVTSSSGGTLSITQTITNSTAATGIKAGYSGGFTTGNVTVKGNAKVTIKVTHNGASGYDDAYGIFAKENITISENASVDITCATPNNTYSNIYCNGLRADKNVTINTDGTIKINVIAAGDDGTQSYGIYPMGNATLTKVGEMEVQWKKHKTNTSYPGGAIKGGLSFDTNTHAVNVDTTNCYASYRFGTPRTVTVENGTLTGPGVKYANGSGYFLAGDPVNITPDSKAGKSGESIPFKKWTSKDVTLTSPTTENNSFTVPGKDVTVTAMHSPFVGTPTFTPTGTTGTEGTLTFKTKVKPDDGNEYFRLVKEADKDDESKYNTVLNPNNSPTASPYEYSYAATSGSSSSQVKPGEYYVAERLNGTWYLSEKFTVSYTAAPSLPAYGGEAADAPSLNTKAGGNVTLNAVTVTGQSIEYGYSTSNDKATAGNWQDSTDFTGLVAGDYYFYARVKANGTTHSGGGVSDASAKITVFAKPQITGYSGNLNDMTIGTAITDITPVVTVPAELAVSNPFNMTGTLPTGLNFDQSDGKISGTPTTYAESGGSVNITVTDKEGITSEAYTLNFGPVKKKTQSITASGVNATYGDIDKSVSATAVGSVSYAVKTGSKDYIEVDPSNGKLTIKKTGDAWVTVTAAATAEYAQATQDVKVTISPKALTNGMIGTIADQTYTGSAIKPEPAVTGLTKGTDFDYSYENNTYVGTAKVKITGKGNYTGTAEKSFNIVAADQTPTIAPTASLKKGGKELDLKTLVSNAKGETIEFTIASRTDAADTAIGADKYTLTTGNATGSVVITVTISSKDENGDGTPEYKAYTGTNAITVTVNDKDTQALLNINSATSVVFGKTLNLSTSGGSGAGPVSYEIVPGGTGTATISGNVLTPTKAGTVLVKATKAADENYNKVSSAAVTITIEQATPTGTPSYTKITADGKTLNNAALAVGTLNPSAGELKWVDDSDSELSSTTTVEKNKAYKWKFIPTDTNYKAVSGTITPYYVAPAGGGGYYPIVQNPTITSGEGVKVTLSYDGTVATITVDPAYELADVVLNGTSKGKVTEVKGLKTGDKLVVKAVKKAAELTEPTKEEILAALADQELAARSKVVTMKNGKKAIRITWYNRNGKMMEFDGVQIFRSTKKSSGYGKKPLFTSKTDKYTNTSVKAGTKYYYKVRGYVVVDGQKYYTDYSLKAIRTVK